VGVKWTKLELNISQQHKLYISFAFYTSADWISSIKALKEEV